MNNNQVIDSLGRIDNDMIAEVAILRERKRPKIILHRWLAIAACLVLILGMAITVEATTGAVSNLLAPLFGGTQTEIVDSIGMPVGASVTVDGYTLTADAIIGDRYNVAVVYTLTREDGEPIPDNAYFSDYYSDFIVQFGGGGSLVPVYDEEDPTSVHFVETWSSNSKLIGRNITARFSNLAIYIEGGEDILLAEGPWELTYKIRYQDSAKKIPVNNLTVTDGSGKKCRIDKIYLSPIGIHLDFTCLNPVWEEPAMLDFNVSIQLHDGTILELQETGVVGMSGEGEGDYEAMFNLPIPIEDISALIICDTTYPITSQ